MVIVPKPNQPWIISPYMTTKFQSLSLWERLYMLFQKSLANYIFSRWAMRKCWGRQAGLTLTLWVNTGLTLMRPNPWNLQACFCLIIAQPLTVICNHFGRHWQRGSYSQRGHRKTILCCCWSRTCWPRNKGPSLWADSGPKLAWVLLTGSWFWAQIIIWTP